MDSLKCLTLTPLFTLVCLHSLPWFPLSLSMGYLVFVNDVHRWPVIRRWTIMFDFDTFIRVMGHVLVAVCIEYLRDWWHSTFFMIPPWSCQYLWDVISHDQILVYYHISSSTMDILFISYFTWRWTHMTFVYHAYSWPLYSYVYGTSICILAFICIGLSFYCIDEWLVLLSRSSLLHFWDGYNVFHPSCYPSDLTH